MAPAGGVGDACRWNSIGSMNAVLKLAGCIALLAAAWCAGEWALAFRSVRHVADKLPALVADEAEITRQAAAQEVRAVRVDATNSIDRFSAQAARQLDQLQAVTVDEVRRLRADLVIQSTLWRAEVRRQGDAANGTLAGVRSDLRPALDNAALLESDASRTVRLVTPQLVGAAAAWKVTGGELSSDYARSQARGAGRGKGRAKRGETDAPGELAGPGRQNSGQDNLAVLKGKYGFKQSTVQPEGAADLPDLCDA